MTRNELENSLKEIHVARAIIHESINCIILEVPRNRVKVVESMCYYQLPASMGYKVLEMANPLKYKKGYYFMQG